jgi:nucleotide-binding universal stress UspA family protein
LPNQLEIQVKPHDNVSQAILEAAQGYDLVVLRSIRRRTSAGGLALGDITAQLVAALTCSIVMLGEPQQTTTAVLPELFRREKAATTNH